MLNAPKNPAEFKYVSKADLPSRPKIKTEWNLKALYYKSEKDPQIEKDIQSAEKSYSAFAKKWRKAEFAENPKLLAQALAELEKHAKNPAFSRPGRYYSFRSVLNSKDSVADKQLAVISKRLRKAGDSVIFFHLKLATLPRKQQKSLLAAPELTSYQYYLCRIFIGSEHNLSEPEEKIIRLKSAQSSHMWVDAVQKILSNRNIDWKNKKLPIPEALETIDLLTKKEKIVLWDLIITEMEQIGEVAEHEFNAIITDVRQEDELRKYKKPYSATALSYEDSETNIENLVQAVSTKGFELSKKFYKLKAKWHGVEKLHYTQKYDTIGSDLAIPFDQAFDIGRDVFYGVKTEYGEIYDRLFANGQVDVFPRVGKQGGAFMSSSLGNPTHVLLNHVSNFKSLETLAHEMGHAVHAERSSLNKPFYSGHSIVTAETASTLFENLLFDAVYAQASESAKPVLLHNRLTRDISTIERQVAFFNAELEIHNTIHVEGAMTNAELAKVMYKHLKSYLGNAVDLSPRDGYSYVYIPHLRYGFYVYSYACGILVSTIMAQKYQEDNRYIEKIDEFLRAGDSATVSALYKQAGIDTSKTDTFIKALDNQAKDINDFEKYLKKMRK